MESFHGTGYISMISIRFKRNSKSLVDIPSYPCLLLVQHIEVLVISTSPATITVFYARLYGRFIERKRHLRRKKLHRTNLEKNWSLAIFFKAV